MLCLVAYINILAYGDDYFSTLSESFLTRALLELAESYPVTWTTYWNDPAGFGAALGSGQWTMVVVTHDRLPGLADWWDSLADYVAQGGRLVLFTYAGSASPSSPLWSRLGAQIVGDFAHPQVLVAWDPTHPIFQYPHQLPDSMFFENRYSDVGDSIATFGPSLSVAGFSGALPALVINDNCMTVYGCFIVDELQGDRDGDGTEDGLELLTNAIYHVWECSGLPVEESPLVLTGRSLQAKRPAWVAVYRLDGSLVLRTQLDANQEVELPQGVFVVAGPWGAPKAVIVR